MMDGFGPHRPTRKGDLTGASLEEISLEAEDSGRLTKTFDDRWMTHALGGLPGLRVELYRSGEMEIFVQNSADKIKLLPGISPGPETLDHADL